MVKKALGRGLGALMPAESVEFQETEGLVNIEVGKIRANAHQPRKEFSQDSLRELANSIKEKGLIQPVVVVKKDGYYELVSGERRTRAAKLANLKTIPAIVRDYNERDKAEIALIENIQREDLNKIEEALAYRALMSEFELTQEQMSKKVGKSRAHIANTVRLLDLSQAAKAYLQAGKITPGHARALLTLDPVDQQEMCELIVKKDLSVRAVEREMKKWNKTQTQGAKIEELPAEIKSFQDQLEEKFSTRVKVRYAKDKGSIQIEYYSKDDLMRISDLLLEL
ncbi:ParB/RepB/Spo0J family partition protein [Clostridia bacterium]|nr:ParB/RepB/Spo0J family partition protein [Clostridia bacterium]